MTRLGAVCQPALSSKSTMMRSRPAPASRANSASSAAKNGLETPFDTYQNVSPEVGCTKAVTYRHRQLDWLWSRQGRRGRAHEGLCPSGHAGDRGPGLKGLGPGGSILGGRAVIAAEVEEIVDPVMGREEALSLAG